MSIDALSYAVNKIFGNKKVSLLKRDPTKSPNLMISISLISKHQHRLQLSIQTTQTVTLDFDFCSSSSNWFIFSSGF